MSLAKINNFANDDTDILAVQSTVDALYNNSYSLTNYDNTTVPAIAAGSKIEVNGSLYRAATEEAISTTDPVTSSTVADGTVYICMIPSGDASTCTAAFTASAPTWSDSKQGWYGTGDYANYKYLHYVLIKSSASYLKHAAGKYKNRFVPYISVTLNENVTQTATAVNMTAVVDALGEVGAESITLETSGLFFVSGEYILVNTTLTTDQTYTIAIRKNGSEVYRGVQTSHPRSSSGAIAIVGGGYFSTVFHCVSGDIITIYASIDRSAALGVAGNMQMTQLY